MFFFYRILINLIFILSPIIVIIRLLQKKEDPSRFREKLGFFSKKKTKGKFNMVSWCKCWRNLKCGSSNRKARKK